MRDGAGAEPERALVEQPDARTTLVCDIVRVRCDHRYQLVDVGFQRVLHQSGGDQFVPVDVAAVQPGRGYPFAWAYTGADHATISDARGVRSGNRPGPSQHHGRL